MAWGRRRNSAYQGQALGGDAGLNYENQSATGRAFGVERTSTVNGFTELDIFSTTRFNILMYHLSTLRTTDDERFKCTSWSSKKISAPNASNTSYLSVPTQKESFIDSHSPRIEGFDDTSFMNSGVYTPSPPRNLALMPSSFICLAIGPPWPFR